MAFLLTAFGCRQAEVPETTVPETTQAPTTVATEPPRNWETGYVAGLNPDTAYYDEEGTLLGFLIRGTQVEYELGPDGRYAIRLGETVAYLPEDASIAADVTQVIPAHTLYVRTAVNLRDKDGRLLETFAQKGTPADVTGYDYLLEDGEVHMYRVKLEDQEGYIMPWYLADNEVNALANELDDFLCAVRTFTTTGKPAETKVSGLQGLRALEVATAIEAEARRYNGQYSFTIKLK